VSKDLALPGPEMPVIDENRLLDEFGGDQEILDELKALFLEHVPPLYEGIENAVAQADAEVLASNVHSLKGACATYGAPRLAEVCKQIEMLARTGDLDAVQANMDVLAEEYGKVFETIQATVDA